MINYICIAGAGDGPEHAGRADQPDQTSQGGRAVAPARLQLRRLHVRRRGRGHRPPRLGLGSVSSAVGLLKYNSSFAYKIVF